MIVDYSNQAWRSSRPVQMPPSIEGELGFSLGPRRVTEAFKGTAIVGWQGKIERQLQAMVEENTEARNHAYADKLRAYLELWRANPLNGSINVETIANLLSGAEVPAVDDWKYSNYFSNLRDKLRELKASVEELPMTDEVPPDQRAPSSSPPSSFGPTEEPPPAAAPTEVEVEEPDAEADQAAAALDGGAPENEIEAPEIPGV